MAIWGAGHEWNVFRNSGPLGPAINMMPGEYVLTVSAKTDRYGVELDRLRINAENQSLTKPIFCGASYVDFSRSG